jgi:hypothetical protein
MNQVEDGETNAKTGVRKASLPNDPALWNRHRAFAVMMWQTDLR